MANYDMLFDITGKTALQPRKRKMWLRIETQKAQRSAIGHEFFAVHSFRTDSDKCAGEGVQSQ